LVGDWELGQINKSSLARKLQISSNCDFSESASDAPEGAAGADEAQQTSGKPEKPQKPKRQHRLATSSSIVFDQTQVILLFT
jgi:hypothetical protein